MLTLNEILRYISSQTVHFVGSRVEYTIVSAYSQKTSYSKQACEFLATKAHLMERISESKSVKIVYFKFEFRIELHANFIKYEPLFYVNRPTKVNQSLIFT